MVGLLDIGSATKKVQVRGVDVEVFGVSAKGVLYLINKFPEIKSIFAGKGIKMSADDFFEMAPGAISSIIAAGCGLPGNEEAESMAASLGLGEQSDLLFTIFDLTFPSGVGPFVERLNSLGAVAEDTGWAQDTKSEKQLKP